MITLYSGTPGSGKSLHAAYDIWERIKYGKPVIANFQINTDVISERAITYYLRKFIKGIKPKHGKIGKFTYLDMQHMTVEALKRYAIENHVPNREGQTLLIIDECGVLFNTRQWDQKGRFAWIEFMIEHRKYGYNIILISQSDRLIDRQIRAFIEYDIKHRCVNNFKVFGQIVGLLAGGKLFACVKYWYGVRERVNVNIITLQRRKANIYDTFTLFRDQIKEDEGSPSDRTVGVPSAAL